MATKQVRRIQFILQTSGSAEVRAIRSAAMLHDDLVVTNASFDGLGQHEDLLLQGAVPVGSVEYVREGMRLAGIREPANLSYPSGCESYLLRSVWRTPAADALAMKQTRFIKPTDTKGFTGFVLGSAGLPLSEHDMEQLSALQALDAATPVWVSDPVVWVSEFRYYISQGSILGYARYDQGDDDDVPEPDMAIVARCIRDLAIEHPYALDMGVLASGQTALVEVNDAFAIGLYQGALKPLQYAEFLANRWAFLVS